jgi:hypothetical protein
MDDVLDANGVDVRCEDLEYPLLRADAAVAFADVTVAIDEAGARDENGDGSDTDTETERNLGVVISELDSDSFAGPEELYDELLASLTDGSGLRGA